jgi:hypothetical protein
VRLPRRIEPIETNFSKPTQHLEAGLSQSSCQVGEYRWQMFFRRANQGFDRRPHLCCAGYSSSS